MVENSAREHWFSMGCGASAVQKELQATQDKLLTSRTEAGERDRQIQNQTNLLIDTINQRSQEVRERERLEQELVAANTEYQFELSQQRNQMEADQTCKIDKHRKRVGKREQQMLEDDEAARRLVEQDETETINEMLAEKVEHATCDNLEFIKREEQRALQAQEELLRTQAEVRIFLQERDNELEAATMTKQAFLAERRAAHRQGEMLMAEVRMQVSETEALQDSYGGLEGKVRSLQYELNKVSYTVGLRDHEVKVKDSELQEVRQSLACIQVEMDEANLQLNTQCARVQRVENSLRGSRDLGEKVTQMREMLNESHSALSQLCGILEEERRQREQCAQGLKQQRVRTEFLLQLLQHFRTRTQDLTPNAILGGNAGGADSCGSLPVAPTVRPNPLR